MATRPRKPPAKKARAPRTPSNVVALPVRGQKREHPARKPSGPRSPTSSTAMAELDRRRQAVELRKAGANYEQIGRQLGISKQAAQQMVARVLKEQREELAEEVEDLRRLELERLDVALTSIWAMVRQGNLLAIDRLLKIQERRARLLGLDLQGGDETPDVIRVVIEHVSDWSGP